MTAGGVVVDLRRSELPWRRVTIPDSTPEVELARLHVDPATRASVSLVRFPPGWARPGAGHFRSAELFVVLDGALQVTGVHYAAGEYGYVPAGFLRVGSRSVAGCLSVAWFSGRPDWWTGAPAAPPAEPTRHGRLGEGAPPAGTGGRAYGAGATPAGPVAFPTELLWPGPARWCLLPAGATPPRLAGPVLVRPWP